MTAYHLTIDNWLIKYNQYIQNLALTKAVHLRFFFFCFFCFSFFCFVLFFFVIKPCILNIKPKTNGYRCSCFKLTSHCGTRCRFEERLLVKNQRYSTIDWVSLLQVNVFLVHRLSSIKPFCRRQRRIQRNCNVKFKLTLEPVEREYVFHWRLSWQVFWLIVIVTKGAMISYITSRNCYCWQNNITQCFARNLSLR